MKFRREHVGAELETAALPVSDTYRRQRDSWKIQDTFHAAAGAVAALLVLAGSRPRLAAAGSGFLVVSRVRWRSRRQHKQCAVKSKGAKTRQGNWMQGRHCRALQKSGWIWRHIRWEDDLKRKNEFTQRGGIHTVCVKTDVWVAGSRVP